MGGPHPEGWRQLVGVIADTLNYPIIATQPRPITVVTLLCVALFLIAAFWGAAHALTPGHGKAMVAAYLVGTKGTPRHALLLGGTVTVAHTAGVFALGFVTLGLSAFIVPEQLYPWLTLASGVLVILVGASVLRQRVKSAGYVRHYHDHDHAHGHAGHAHDHRHDDALTSKGILGVGVAAGLLPCPSALVVLLSAIALHRIGLGLALIVAFSVGLAATITSIGLVAVLARRTFGRISDGKSREAWVSWDTLSLMQQLGAVPETAPTRTV